MTFDEAILHCEEVADGCSGTECKADHRQLAEWLKELKERREQFADVSKKDTISRKAAIDALDGEITITGKTNAEAVRDYVKAVKGRIERIPPIQPKRGRWIDDGQYDDYSPHHAWLCSECGDSVIEVGTPWYNFCPNCGADMRGRSDDE